jgi:metal-responsive CopG/Arc/MetJ family transcriptional regulator
MIESPQGGVNMTVRLTLSLSSEILNILDNLAKELETTRSGAVTELIYRYNLAKGYAEWAETNKKEAEFILPSYKNK